MPNVFIPPLLRALTDGTEKVEVPGATVKEAIDALDTRFPGIHDRLCNGDALKPGLTVAVDGHVSSFGLLQKVEAESEIHFLPAVGGG